MNRNNKGIWNKDFVLVWQGHFTSAVGSVVYSIAIGFYILELTGSTAMMGAIIAISQIPRLFLSPVAGALIDRFNKKWILIIGDLVSGFSVLILAFVLLFDRIGFFALAITALILGSVQAFFAPAVQAGLPLLVPKNKITQANAVYSTIGSGSQILGRFTGGYIYVLFGPIISFSFNGLSFIISAISELFINSGTLRPSEIKNKSPNSSIIKDIKGGLRILNKVPGLIPIFCVIAFLNFCGFMVITLYIPLFQNTNGLGVKLYGVVMAASTIGLLIGNIALSKMEIQKSNRFPFFIIAGILSNVVIVIFPYQNSWIMLCVLIFLSGILSSPINVILNSSLQISIDERFQGRIFSLIGMIGGLLIPLAILLAGVVAEITDVRLLISINAAILAAAFFLLLFVRDVRTFINTEFAK